jgi:hypothetical protein
MMKKIATPRKRAIPMKTCSTCELFDPDYYGDFVDDTDDRGVLGECEWSSEDLPWSLRYGSRERVAVYAREGDTCCGWKEKSKSKAFTEGSEARKCGWAKDTNPYDVLGFEMNDRTEWAYGWEAADEEFVS